MQRILQQHVGRSDFIDYSEVASLALEIREPPADNGFVIFFFRHDYFSRCLHSNSRPPSANILNVEFGKRPAHPIAEKFAPSRRPP
jgi:hypothetical protein